MPNKLDRKSDSVIAYFSKASGIERREVASLPTEDAAAKVQKLLRQQAALARFGSFALREWDLLNILSEAVRVCADGLGAIFLFWPVAAGRTAWSVTWCRELI
jgi:hypothetical protein